MSAPTLPSPVPRSASIGPGENAPNFQRPMVNGTGPSASGGTSAPSAPMSQHNLNQIVSLLLSRSLRFAASSLQVFFVAILPTIPSPCPNQQTISAPSKATLEARLLCYFSNFSSRQITGLETR